MTRTATAIAAILFLAACNTPTPAQTPAADTVTPAETPQAAIADESTRLNTWFEAKFLETVARSPMTQTYLGIKDDYGQWDDVSEAHALGDIELQRAIVAEMKATFDYDTLDPQAKLSWRLAEYELSQAEAAFPFRDHAYVFNQMFGVQSGIPAFLVNQHKVTSLSDAEAYISRLEGIPAYLGQNVANAQASAAKGILPPRFVYDYVLSDSRGVITGYPFIDAGEDSPIMEDFRNKVTALVEAETITQEEAEPLLARAAAALRDGVGPAYEAAIVELEAQTSAATTDDGAWKLPDADAYYAMRLKQITTTDMTADEIHELGLAEVARIQDEMRGIMKQVGFEGTLKEFFEFTRTDPQFFKPNTDEGRAEYLAEATAAIDAMREDLPTVFKTFPKADLIVKAVEPFREQSAGKAFYSRPAPDGSRPGTYYANLYRMQDMPTYQLQALAFHEGIPGHHMQIAMAQELEGIPSFRKYGGYTAYTEGWGLYSELLPKEMGYYSDPYDDFGRLAMEIWRAARLVVDTGIHDRKWTREQAVQYLLDNTPNPEGDCQKAIDRYIVMPGQATAYKIGMLKIVELREMAKAELGDAFDIRGFHDVVLRDGAVPLAILEQNVRAWVEETKES
ncbi:MAG: lipoprotein [Hyphomonas sp. BRH_c22]|uniref:DUF885 domain-containing protein n=1 Tax=Hyphomonas sp. BRH_c22 TaxID=1629710 RepID=UPI0005F1C46C|nr:DUF885 domain-containing protein [Hyphomonas sp. BRH_c22]KJS35463.1 MAG: lipoprotein [Hyphomonas sp. BRH_c22]